MKKITFCIPSKSNLRYLRFAIESIYSQNSGIRHDIIVYVDEDHDGTIEWLQANHPEIKLLINESSRLKGIAYAYNRCIEKAETDIVCMFHADMYMSIHFDAGIMKYIKPGTIVSATRIEPPLHPAGKEKLIADFGIYPEDFHSQLFLTETEKLIIKNKDKITKGIFAPWAAYKSDLIAIGMHDEKFHSYHEDSDIFNRFVLNGYELIQTWESYVYHFTCRGGQFQDGVEQVTTNEDFHRMKNRAADTYLKKWGRWIKNDEYMYPIVPHKYNINFIVQNCNVETASRLRYWCDKLFANTTNYEPADIIIEFDINDLDNESSQLISTIPDLLDTITEIGTYEYGPYKITVFSLKTYENELVHIY